MTLLSGSLFQEILDGWQRFLTLGVDGRRGGERLEMDMRVLTQGVYRMFLIYSSAVRDHRCTACMRVWTGDR